MICPQCGTETTAEALYCHRCGTRLDTAVPSTPEPAAPADRLQAAAAAHQTMPEEPEQDLWAGSYAPRAMVGLWALGGLLTLVGLGLGIGFRFGKAGWIAVLAAILLMWLWLLVVYSRRRLGVRYRLTSQRFFHEAGLLRHVTDRIEVIDIDDVTCTQGPVERMLGIGTIRLNSSDRTHPELVVGGIENVQHVATLIDDARRRERVRRGLHIEQV